MGRSPVYGPRGPPANARRVRDGRRRRARVKSFSVHRRPRVRLRRRFSRPLVRPKEGKRRLDSSVQRLLVPPPSVEFSRHPSNPFPLRCRRSDSIPDHVYKNLRTPTDPSGSGETRVGPRASLTCRTLIPDDRRETTVLDIGHPPNNEGRRASNSR